MMWIDKGGPIVWILVAYSVIGFSILAGRYLQLMFTQRAKLAQPVELWKETAEKRIVVKLQQKQKRHGHGPELRTAATHLIYNEIKVFETGLKTVSILANTAPLLGLLGTIAGMIKAFQVIENAGGKVDATALAGGIWEAMLTTGVGLAVAIPLLIFLHFLESALARYHWRLQKAAALVLDHHDLELSSAPEKSTNEGVVSAI